MKLTLASLAVAMGSLMLSSPTPGIASAAAGPPSYTITDLGTLGGTNSYALSINNSDTIVGASETSTTVHAFRYSGGAITDLGTLPSPYNASSIAFAINDAGQIVGTSTQGSGVSRHAFRTSAGGTLATATDLGALGTSSGPDDSTALGINTNGVTVGYSFAAFAQASQPFIYNTSLSTISGAGAGIAFGISSTDQVAGFTYYSYGFETRQVAYVLTGFGTILLGPTSSTSGGPNSIATAINNSAQVAGYIDYHQSGTGYDNLSHAFLYNTNTLTKTDLGTTPYAETSEAFGLNNNGAVVGTAFNYGSRSSITVFNNYYAYGHAVLFQTGHAYDLNELLTGTGSSAWTVGAALGINDNGKIVGFGTIGGSLHAFLLTPTGSAAQAPGAPSGLTASSVAGKLQVNLAFTDHSGGHAQSVVERRLGSGAFTLLTTLPAGTTAYQDTSNLAAGATYTYRVKARTSVGDSAYAVSPSVTIPSAATDVSAKVTVTRTGFRYNRGTGNYVQTLTLTNTGATTTTGPLSLVLDNLQANLITSADGATVATTPTGSPYLNVSAGSLSPGGKLTVLLQFTPQTITTGGGEEGSPGTTTNLPITYTTRVLAGSGIR